MCVVRVDLCRLFAVRWLPVDARSALLAGRCLLFGGCWLSFADD